MTDNIYDILNERGFVAQVTDADALRAQLAREQVTFYIGYDPTADSLHIGHLVTIMAMMHMQRAGHRPIALVGGGTAMIGDPSGKTEMRKMLSAAEIQANADGLQSQMRQFLGENAIYTNNAKWLLDLNYIKFLREIGRHFSVNRMLAAEGYKQRWERGLNFIELNYQIMQAYDFLELYRRFGCTLQMGGDDQWSNLLAGVDLIRREESVTVQAMTYPLLTTAGGTKMGKTERGAVWLDPARVKPYDYYQYWINCDDRDVEKLLKIFTFLPPDEIKRLAALTGAELRGAKKVLAFEATKIVHGEAEAEAAQKAAAAAFAGGGDLSAMPTTAIDAARLEAGIGVLEIFAEVGLTKSRGEARRMVQQGGIYINNTRVDAVDATISATDLTPDGILLRAGKKRYHRLVRG